MSKHILYGAEMSYFSGKARAYLRWKGVPFEERRPDAAFFATIAVPRIGRPVIPVLLTPDNVAMQDTTQIMDHFEADPGYPRFTPSDPLQALVASLIELYADNWLLIPGLHYRWEYDTDETILEFGMNAAPDASREEQRAIGEKASAMFRNGVSVLGIHPHTKDAIETNWRGVLAELDTHFRTHDFLFGNRPSLGDFGLVGALYAHMYRDATAGTLMRREAMAVCQYVERMMVPNGAELGEYETETPVPHTLMPILKRIMHEQMPGVLDTAERLAAWKIEHPQDAIPRGIGFHDFELEGVTAQRAVMPYVVWMYERTKRLYEAMTGDARSQADQLLDQIDGEAFKTAPLPVPLKLENHILQWAD